MSKTVIIYKTKYNTTKKYAGWLAIKIDADLYEISDIRSNDLKKYDTIIFGGAIENGYIKGIEFDKVYVIPNKMGRNEKFIAYTRALSELIIVINEYA